MYDLVVLGGGAGGLNVASAAARVGARVALVEKLRLGGECTHTACVPSKSLIQAARRVHEIRTAGAFGIRVGTPEVDFPAVMDRVRAVVGEIDATHSAEDLRARGIDVIFGLPAFEAYDTVVVDRTRRINGHRFVIATGSRPDVPDIPGLAEAGYHDNTTIWELTELPAALVVLGAGPVGIEFAQAFARLGSRVTVLANDSRILPREDPEVSEALLARLATEGIAFQLGVEVTHVTLRADGRKVCAFRSPAEETAGEVEGTHLLVATGRRANVEGLNLEAVGVRVDPAHGHAIEVDETLQTRARNIWAVGDVLGRYQFTHAAEREAAVVFMNAVLRLSRRIDYSALPWATFVDPEVATVGLAEPQARDRDPEARVFRVEYGEVDRARIDGASDGFAKLIASASGKILGATIVGEEASTVLQEFVLAMENGLTLKDIVNTVHTYPTMSALARRLALQYSATRLENGLYQTALRWFFGYHPIGSGGPAPASGTATEGEPVTAAPDHPGPEHGA